MKKRILFLCAQHSIRSQMAESILTFRGHEQWDVWSTPIEEQQERALAQNVLTEIGIPLVETPQTTKPDFGLQWDAGVILCSGMVDTWPIIPGAVRHHYWPIEDLPALPVTMQEQLEVYRRVRDILYSLIANELLLESMRKAIPLHK